MDHFAGLDVSVKETSVCIVDDVGKIVREVKVASEPPRGRSPPRRSASSVGGTRNCSFRRAIVPAARRSQ
jgi:hypothetical protein